MAILSGLVLAAGFPPIGLGLLAFVALIPLFLAIEGTGKKKGFLLGLVTGFVFFLSTVYWVVNSMYFYGGLGLSTSIPAMLLLVLFLSVYFALFGLLFSAASTRRGAARLVLVPALWTSLEYLRGNLFTGFPWVLLGYSQVPYPHVIQVADLAGVWGVSFVVALVNTGIFLYSRSVIRGEARGRGVLIITAAIVIAVVSYGLVRIKQVDRDLPSWKEIDVAIVQGNIDQGVKWDTSYQLTTLDTYEALTLGSGGELTIWPETAVPFYLGVDDVGAGLVGEIARKSRSFLLTGGPSYRYNPDAGKVEYFNSVFLFTPGGEVSGQYDKVHLVPFGEYVPRPVKKLLPFIDKFTAGVGDFSSGPGPLPVSFEDGAVGPIVCYEAIFPELSRGHVKNGARIIVNLTNDAWFGRTSAPYQHFSMAALRAVENRAYLLRAANTGISGIIDPAGRVVEKSGLFERAVITGTVRIREGRLTFYSRYGDVFAYALLLLSGVFVAMSLRKGGR